MIDRREDEEEGRLFKEAGRPGKGGIQVLHRVVLWKELGDLLPLCHAQLLETNVLLVREGKQREDAMARLDHLQDAVLDARQNDPCREQLAAKRPRISAKDSVVRGM